MTSFQMMIIVVLTWSKVPPATIHITCGELAHIPIITTTWAPCMLRVLIPVELDCMVVIITIGNMMVTSSVITSTLAV